MLVMKTSLASALLCVILAFAAPSFANDAEFKKQAEQLSSEYSMNFGKQNAAGIAALYATGGIIVNAMGTHPDIAQFYDGSFKAGFNKLDLTVDQASALGPDTGIGTGKFRVTGKNQSGAPIEGGGIWAATYVREAGKWKVRMMTGILQPAAPK